MQTYIIYVATNLINGKQYVGQTKAGRLDRRIFEHLFDATHLDQNIAFHNAILKYGIDNFSFDVIEKDISETMIDQREIYGIAHYNTYIHAENSNGYNETLGGQGTHGYVFTEEDKQKMSAKQKAYGQNLKLNNVDEYNRLCEIRRQNKLGKKGTEESRMKLSESCKGRLPGNKGTTGAQVAWNKGTSTCPNILMLDINTGQQLKSFINVYEAARQMFPDKNTRTTATRIFTVCKAGYGKAYGYLGRFAE